MKTFGSSHPVASAMVAAILGVAATTGCNRETADGGIVSLRPAATANVPFSMHFDVALVSENVACVITSFEPFVYCVDGQRQVVARFGREGEGPGELRRPNYVERGPDGVVAVFDLARAQMTSFRPDGNLVSETRMPVDFVGAELRDGRVLGFRLAMLDRTRPENQSRFVAATVDVASGEFLWERDIAEAVERDCFNGIVGVFDPKNGSIVTTACEHELVFLANWDDTLATVVPSPNYVRAFPNERDVDAYVGRVTRLGGGVAHLSTARKEAYAT